MTTTGLGRTTTWKVLDRLEETRLVRGIPARGERDSGRVVTWHLDQAILVRTLSLLHEHLGEVR